MHYKDGTEAKIGDIVRGKGYNHPYDVQGVVVGVFPGANSCNIRVAHTKISEYMGIDARYVQENAPFVQLNNTGPYLRQEDGSFKAVFTEVESGTCGDFELVYRKPEPQQKATQG